LVASEQTLIPGAYDADDHLVALHQQAVPLQQVPGPLRIRARVERAFDDALGTRGNLGFLNAPAAHTRYAIAAVVLVVCHLIMPFQVAAMMSAMMCAL
jgi:hypothetical protein